MDEEIIPCSSGLITFLEMYPANPVKSEDTEGTPNGY
jgi:hypothetical protein